MKELQQQVRRSALWRFWGFWIFAVALTTVFLLSTHILNASRGIADVEAMREKIKLEKETWLKEREDLEKKKLELKKALQECKENNDLDVKLADCQGEILLLDDDIDILYKKKQSCETKLQALQFNN